MSNQFKPGDLVTWDVNTLLKYGGDVNELVFLYGQTPYEVVKHDLTTNDVYFVPYQELGKVQRQHAIYFRLHENKKDNDDPFYLLKRALS